MKRILYLNTDTLSSYMSQIDDGLIKNKTETVKSDIENERTKKIVVDGAASVDVKIFGKGVDAKADALLESGKKDKEADSFSNSIEKVIFDETLDTFEKYLESNNYLEENDNIGDFVKLEDQIFIVDLEYYKNTFSNKTVLNMLKDSDVEKKLQGQIANLDDSEEDVNRKKKKPSLGQLRDSIKKEVDKEYEYVLNMIDVVLNIVPYNKFGIMGDYLISLDDEYFRDKANVVAFKYGGMMSCLGHITNIINDDVNSDGSNVFTSFPSIINSVMLTFFNRGEIKILHPIAIYY